GCCRRGGWWTRWRVSGAIGRRGGCYARWPDAVRPPARAPDGVVVKGTGRTHGVGRSVAGTASGAWQAYSRHAAPGDIRVGALRRHAALRLAPGLSRFGGDLVSRTAPLTFPAPPRR